MISITYSPRGRGCSAHLDAPGGLELEVALTEREDSAPTAVGAPEFADNLALVTLLQEYAGNELAYRKLRSPERRKSHKEAAARDRKDAESIAELVLRLGERVADGWCSGCFEETEHRHVKGHDRPSRKYLCQTCGTPTTRCGAPKCKHFAIVNARALHTIRYCAQHRHEIPSFQKLEERIEHLADCDEWLRFESRNLARITKVAGGTLGAAVVIAPMAFLAAPVVGAALGGSAVGGGLGGAAATGHGLAMLGGGSIASGGLGIAGGTAVVTATGSALGGALGAATVASYVGADKSFRIERVRVGSGPPVVFATGFLTEGLAAWSAWQRLIDTRYSNSTVYHLHWGAKELRDLGGLIASGGAKAATLKLLANRAKRGTRALGSLPGIGAVFAASEVLSNPWSVARARAGMTGAALADLIARTDEGPFVLLGHSLGARVMVEAAQALGTRSGRPKIEAMHLLGAAVGNRGDWQDLDRAVSGSIWNYYSSNDQVLRRVFSVAEAGKKAVGFTGFNSKFPSLRDRNVSRMVEGHSAYVRAVELAG